MVANAQYDLEDYRQIFSQWDEEIWPVGEPRLVMIDTSLESFKSLRNKIDKLAKSLGFRRTSEEGGKISYSTRLNDETRNIPATS